MKGGTYTRRQLARALNSLNHFNPHENPKVEVALIPEDVLLIKETSAPMKPVEYIRFIFEYDFSKRDWVIKL